MGEGTSGGGRRQDVTVDTFNIHVRVSGKLVDLGSYDRDHINIIALLHALYDNNATTEHSPILPDDHDIFIEIPWNGDRLSISSDREMLGVFDLFDRHEVRKLVFVIERKGYTPVPLFDDESTSRIPEPVPIGIMDDFEEMIFGGEDMGECEGVGDDKDVESMGHDVDEEENMGDDMDREDGMGNDVEGEGVDDDNLNLFEDYQSNDEDDLGGESNDENLEAIIARCMQGVPFVHGSGGKIRFQVNQIHDSVYSLRELLREYAIQEGIALIREKNEKDRLTYKCKAVGCQWRIHASLMKDKVNMKIKRYNDVHNCHRSYKSEEAKVKWIASKFERLVKNNPDVKVGVMKEILRDRFHVNVDAQKLYKAKQRALSSLAKDHTECFKHLRRYAYMVRHSNPGSIAYIRLQEPEPTFQRFMLSFAAQRDGFLAGCRPFIGLDGCFLKGPFKGILLSAVALDANNGLYPLAVCICEGECEESWSWFIQNLKRYLNMPVDQPVTFMSDRQKGILTALKLYWPEASTRYCARHICANFRQKYASQKLKNLFWQASRSTEKWEFKHCMERIGKLNTEAQKWLEKIYPEHWSRYAFDPRIKCDHVTNNMTESFNNMLGNYRAKTYIQLLEHIRRIVMQRFHQREQQCARWSSELPPFVNNRIIKASLESRDMTILQAGRAEFEVIGTMGRAYVTKLQDFTCECGAWQISGVPCVHAVASIAYSNQGAALTEAITTFVHPYLTKSAFKQTYENMIHPIPDICAWQEVATEELIPPIIKQQPGRPKIQRIREPGEKAKEPRGSSVSCKLCGTSGHNKRTCKVASKAKNGVNSNKNNKSTSKRKRNEVGSSSQSQQRCQSQVTVDLG